MTNMYDLPFLVFFFNKYLRKKNTVIDFPFVDLFFDASFQSDSCFTYFLPVYSRKPPVTFCTCHLIAAQLVQVNTTFWERCFNYAVICGCELKIHY